MLGSVPSQHTSWKNSAFKIFCLLCIGFAGFHYWELSLSYISQVTILQTQIGMLVLWGLPYIAMAGFALALVLNVCNLFSNFYHDQNIDQSQNHANLQQPSSSLDNLHPEPTVDTRSNLELLVANYQSYACSDARTYSRCIAPGKNQEVLQRYQNLSEYKKSIEARANSGASPFNGKYSKQQIDITAKLIDQAQSACCTTFALSAASKIMAQFPNVRVEIVGSPIVNGQTAHCFLVVNREEQSSPQEQLSSHQRWGAKTLIIDPWLTSLGWEGVFTPRDYPFQNYLRNLNVFFDSNELPLPVEQQVLETENENLAALNPAQRLRAQEIANGLQASHDSALSTANQRVQR